MQVSTKPLRILTVLAATLAFAAWSPHPSVAESEPGSLPVKPGYDESRGSLVLTFPASERTRETFEIFAWAVYQSSDPWSETSTTQAIGTSQDGVDVASLRFQQDAFGSASVHSTPPHVRGATKTLREFRKLALIQAYLDDIDAENSAEGPFGLQKSAGSECLLKRAALAAAITAATAACASLNPVACGAALLSVAIAAAEVENACGNQNSLCQPGAVDECWCTYDDDCESPLPVGVRYCNQWGSSWSSCVGCPSGPPDCTGPDNSCSPTGSLDESSYCADNECNGADGFRVCNSINEWEDCTCDGNPSDECDYEGQTAPQACASEINCPLGETATKVCVSDENSNRTWSECFCDDGGGSDGDPEPPGIDDVGPPFEPCPYDNEGCITEVDGRRLCRECLLPAENACLAWGRWEPC